MGKYAKYEQKSKRDKREIHPVWRGIGCILMIIVPAMSYALALLVIPPIQATGYLPHDLFTRVSLPSWTYQTPVITYIATFISSIDNLYALLIFFFVILLILSSIVSLVYAGIYQAIGPARYSAVDAPPSTYKAKRYKR